MRVCTVDIGTNSVRGLIADVSESGGVKVLHREGHITRLGEELRHRRLLSKSAIERTARAVERIVGEARRMGVGHFKLVATSAARTASNSGELVERTRQLTSLETEVITGLEEAEYVCCGAVSSLPLGTKDVLLADIGGGSTELILARGDEKPALCSAAIGAVYLTDECIRNDPPREEELSTAVARARAVLEKAYAGLPRGAGELIGLGGTITTIPPLLLEMQEYDASRVHGYVVAVGDVEAILARLAVLSLEKRKRVKGLETQRADIIIGGLLIVKALLGVTGFTTVRVSDRGILFGLALSCLPGPD